ncbi:hypothetical protein DY000_02041621 [Brassica cretica]|uniref:CSC1/OSCA1-like 7TM region domain-containing protein n=1 Tax=Brassica cretica TaxID=69181 RepID=A0ABQ7BDS3_BRACR|nr:hypothetical protein DY000_02041621 [Brassica cretica]
MMDNIRRFNDIMEIYYEVLDSEMKISEANKATFDKKRSEEDSEWTLMDHETEKDREEATDPGTIGFNTGEPQIQLYFLLGLVYAAVSPILLPFIILFFAQAYVVYRHQVRIIESFSSRARA